MAASAVSVTGLSLVSLYVSAVAVPPIVTEAIRQLENLSGVAFHWEWRAEYAEPIRPDTASLPHVAAGVLRWRSSDGAFYSRARDYLPDGRTVVQTIATVDGGGWRLVQWSHLSTVLIFESRRGLAVDLIDYRPARALPIALLRLLTNTPGVVWSTSDMIESGWLRKRWTSIMWVAGGRRM